MKHDYLPRSDAKMLQWAESFGRVLSAAPGPEGYGVSAAELAEYGELVDGYRQAFLRATQPSTRGPAAVLAKNEAKRSLVGMSRVLARLVGAQPGLSAEQRVNLGLGPGHGGSRRRRPVARPKVAPTVRVASVDGDLAEVRVYDVHAAGLDKPAGVHGVLLFYYVGERLPGGWSDWAFGLSTTATRFGFSLPRTWAGTPITVGAKVWLSACWVSPTLETGPMATPIYRRIGLAEAPSTRRLGLAA
jgi:hypothetical protein